MNLSLTLSKERWLVCGGWGVVASAALVFYLETVLRHTSNWLTYEGSYRLLILALGLYMTWQRKSHFKLLQTKPSIISGSALTALGCFLAICGDRSSTLLLQDASFIITSLGVIWLLLGVGYLKAFWVCAAYLAFILPVFEESLKHLSSCLQIIGAWIAASVLKAMGISVFVSGQLLELPHITLNVIEECSGVHHITSLLALAIPVSVLSQKSSFAKVIFILSAGLFGVFANGLRIALIGIWTTEFKSGPIHGPFDLLYVSFILFSGSAFILLIGLLSKKIPVRLIGRTAVEYFTIAGKRAGRQGSSQNAERHERSGGVPPFTKEGEMKRSVAAIVTALSIFVVAGSYLNWCVPIPVDLETQLSSFPKVINEWRGSDISISDTPFAALQAPAYLNRVYEDDLGNEVTLYVGYFARQEQGKELVNDVFDWMHRQAKTVVIQVDSEVAEIKQTTVDQPGKKKIFYLWYDINGRIITSEYAAKFFTLHDALFKRKTNGAIAVIVAEENVDADVKAIRESHAQFIKRIFPLIKKHLVKT